MAQLVIAAAGAAIGGALAPAAGGAVLFGMTGAQLGWMGGSVLGSMLVGGQRTAGPRLEELRVTGTEYGGGIAWVAGAPRVAGDLIWASERREIATTEEVGKGGGSEYTTFTYEIDALYLLADQPDAIVTRCWDNGKLIWTNLASADDESRLASELTEKWRRITVYDGADAQLPDPTYEAAVTNAPAYTRRLCVFIESLQLGSSGSLPNLTFEVASSGDTNPNFERRVAVPDTGKQFADSYAAGLGKPAILAMQPTVRVGVLSSNTVYVFDADGVFSEVATRTGEESPYPDAEGSNWPGVSSYPVGILGGLPVRAMKLGTALNAATSPPNHLAAGWKTALEVGTGFAIELTSTIADQTRFLGSVALCSDGVHALVMTAPSSATGGGAVIDRWHLIHFDGTTVTTVDEGDIEEPHSIYTFAFGNSTTYHYGCSILEDDLKHVWVAYGAGEGPVMMFKIESDGALRLRSSLRSLEGGLLQYGFTRPSVWAEGSFCVAVSRQSYQAFRRVGDAILEVPLRDVVEALCDRATMPAGTYDASALAAITQPVRALAVSNGNARQALEILQSSHGFDAYVTDKLYFVPRGGASVLTVDADDLAAGENDAQDEPFALTVNSDLEMPSRIAVVYRNMSADQVNGTEHSERGPTGQDSIQTMQLAIGMTPGEAKGVADAMVRDAYAARITSQLSLPLTYTHLTPTDVIQVPGSDGTVYRMRITRRSDSGGVMTLDVVGDDGEVVVEEMVTDASDSGQTAVARIADTELLPMDTPLLRDADDGFGYYVAVKATSSRWPGCVVQSSADGVTFATAATVSETAVFGVATTILGAWSGGWVMDEKNTLTVNVGAGQLSTVTRDALLADLQVNAMLVGDEVIRFCTATLVSSAPNIYTLSRLLRGQRGTEWATDTHGADESVALLTARGLRRVSQAEWEINQARYLRAVTLGKDVADAAVSTFTNFGDSSRPPAPVGIRATRQSNGDLVFTWSRRTRYATKFTGSQGSVVPLGEAAESYYIAIYPDSSYDVPVIGFTVTQPSYTYTIYDQTSFVDGNPFTEGKYFVKVRQIGALNGYYGTAEIPLSVFDRTYAPGVLPTQTRIRAFFWHDLSTSASTFAYSLPEYGGYGDGSSEVWGTTSDATTDRCAALIKPFDSYGPGQVYRFGDSMTEATMSSGVYLHAIAYDADTDKLMALVPVDDLGPYTEYIISPAGVVESSTAITVVGGTDQFAVPLLIKYLGLWRAFETELFGRYMTRDSVSATWTKASGDPLQALSGFGQAKGIVGAAILDVLGSDILFVLVHTYSGSGATQTRYSSILRSDDGVSFTVVSTILEAATSVFPPRVGVFSNRLHVVGGKLTYYYTSGFGITAWQSSTDGLTWTSAPIVIDGLSGQRTAKNFVSCSAGVAAHVIHDAGYATARAALVVSADGITFTEVPDADVWATGYANAPGDYVPVAGHTSADIRAPLLASGSRILFERALVSS